MPKHASPSHDDHERQEIEQHHGHHEHLAGCDEGDLGEDGQHSGERCAYGSMQRFCDGEDGGARWA
eukprot:15316103-Heterocapsa_arctica.AAC.1